MNYVKDDMYLFGKGGNNDVTGDRRKWKIRITATPKNWFRAEK